jgi:hypothetical protein
MVSGRMADEHGELQIDLLHQFGKVVAQLHKSS